MEYNFWDIIPIVGFFLVLIVIVGRSLFKPADIDAFSPEKIKIVWGMSVDKKIDDILTLLPVESNYYWCSANNPRAFIAKDLKIKASEFSLKGEAFNSVYSAYQNALIHLEKDELLLVAGSVFVVADLLSEIN